jgi:acetyl-CoA carboxylase biotin carboxyl carrier protein
MAKGRKPETKNGSSDVLDTVRSLAAVVVESSLSELIVDLPEATITLRRGIAAPVHPLGMQMMPQVAIQQHTPVGPQSAMAAAVAAGAAAAHAGGPTLAPAPVDNAHVVTSPFVGTFYRRPNPDSPTYVGLNDKVQKGQVLCIVEAMKLMNEIEADASGTVVGILAEDGAPVEYGQPLFKIAT